jgi:hypothetical protein
MNVFQPIRDIPTVEGSFVFDSLTGALVASDLQALFRQDMLAAASKRMVTMFAIADQNFEVCDEWSLQFDRYHLFARRAGRLSICVVSREQPRVGILRMAVNLVLHEVETQLTPSSPPIASLTYQPAPTPRGPPSSAAYGATFAPPPRSMGAPLNSPSNAGIAPPASRPPASRPVPGSRPTPQQSPSRPSAPGKKKNGIWG